MDEVLKGDLTQLVASLERLSKRGENISRGLDYAEGLERGMAWGVTVAKNWLIEIMEEHEND